jgi:carbon monoxide dehydrogenase subunit G
VIEIADRVRLDAPPDAVWRTLNDPARLAAALPNVADVRVDGAERFTATIHPETALGLTAFEMAFRLRNGDRRLTIDGRAVSADRAMELTATLELQPDGAGTVVGWQASARLLGPLGALVQRVLPDILRGEIDRALRAADALARAHA